MKKLLFITSILTATLLSFAKSNVLIVTGENNHGWSAIVPELKKMLEKTGEFDVTIQDDVAKLNKDSFKDVDVIVGMWNSYVNGKGKNTQDMRLEKEAKWTKEVQKAYSDAIAKGTGHVTVHASSDNLFPDWDDWRTITMGTWAEWVRPDGTKAKTFHGAKGQYYVSPVKEHPITKGLPKNMPSADKGEMWVDIKVTNPDAEVILMSETKEKSLKATTPQISGMVTNFGEGRCFITYMGHAKNTLNATFETIFVRGVQWAAKKEVKHNALAK